MSENKTNIFQKVQSTIDTHQLLLSGERVLIGISGGPDSVFLGYVLRELGYEIGLAHINYQLRGEASDRDEDVVRAYAEEWNVPVFVKRVNTPALLEERETPMQVLARDIRYAFFESVMDEHKFPHCAIAHHADDQVENLLMSLIHGNSSYIWKGMPIKRGRYVRPLLELSRIEIMESLEHKGLTWRLDESNLKTDYLRNKYRINVIPQIERVQPDSRRRLLEKEEWYQLQHRFIKKHIRQYIPKATSISAKGKEIDWSHFSKEMGEEYVPLLLVYVLEEWGIHGNLMWECVRLQSSMVGKWVETSEGRVVRSRKGFVLLEEELIEDDPLMVDVFESEMNLHFQQKSLSFRIGEDIKPVFGKKDCFYLDADRLEWPLKIRTWKQGDRMQPFGMKQRKKLSDIFVDEKYSPLQKRHAVIIEDQKEIMCLSGFRISDRVKISNNTRRILQIRVLDE